MYVFKNEIYIYKLWEGYKNFYIEIWYFFFLKIIENVIIRKKWLRCNLFFIILRKIRGFGKRESKGEYWVVI